MPRSAWPSISETTFGWTFCSSRSVGVAEIVEAETLDAGALGSER
jgi:hypothetical protein